MLTRDGIKTNPDKVNAIKSFPLPQNFRKLQLFLCTAPWSCRFVPDLAKRAITGIMVQMINLARVLACPEFTVRFLAERNIIY